MSDIKMSQSIKLNKYIGQRFGKLQIISISQPRKQNNGVNRSYVICKCDCGSVGEYRLSTIKYRVFQSCGCYKIEKATTHGLSKNPISSVFYHMKTRCTSPLSKDFKHYGGRGIKICNEWMNDLSSFIRWANSNGYQKGLEIDRINNDGNYVPDNCRWVTHKVNCNNRRGNKIANLSNITL